MPAEFSRTTARKRIKLGDSFVDVPIITAISFIDSQDRFQETQASIDNSGSSNRTVHVDIVYHTNEDHTQDKDVDLKVERIDKWDVIDSQDRYQETQPELDNVTGADSAPPSFTTHLKTHVVRYKNPDDPDNVWIDSELIDEFTFVDPIDRFQETVYSLSNPQNDDDAQADPNDPEISDTAQGVDPPWRTDPFQNIVNFSNHPPHRFKQYHTIYSVMGFSGPFPPFGYEGAFGIHVPPLNFSVTDAIPPGDDAGTAVSQAEAIISPRIITQYSGATITEQTGVLSGPSSEGSFSVSFRTTWWIIVGDGYNLHGVKVGTVPDVDYTVDPDRHFWWLNGVGTPFLTDPGPPPLP